MPPAIVVRLGLDELVSWADRKRDIIETYVHEISAVIAKRRTNTEKVSIFGMSDTIRRNLTNSVELHALSRYLPP